MRLIAGILKGRKLPRPPSTTRPTSSRGREQVFNILTNGMRLGSTLGNLEGRRVLDVFAGTGAFAFEALSRGAQDVSLLESHAQALQNIQQFCQTLPVSLKERVTVIAADGTRPPRAPHSFDILFLDPPYGSGLIESALGALSKQFWVSPHAVLVLETETLGQPLYLQNWTHLRTFYCSKSAFSFWRAS